MDIDIESKYTMVYNRSKSRSIQDQDIRAGCPKTMKGHHIIPQSVRCFLTLSEVASDDVRISDVESDDVRLQMQETCRSLSILVGNR